MDSNKHLLFFIPLLLITLCFSKELEKVTLKFQWLNQFQFAGYYVAKEKGFYEDLGLDVTIIEHNNDSHLITEVVENKITFGTSNSSLLIYKNQGYPVVVLAAIFQHSPAALLVTDKKILSLNDLMHKKIMISKNAMNSASYISMLFSEGIGLEDIIAVKHSYNINDLIEKKVDAIAAYISNEPYFLLKNGISYKYFHPKDYGFDFYGDLLFTSAYQIEKNPLQVENFTKASLKGWKYAFDNINETADLIYKKYNTQNKTIEQLIFEGEILKYLAYDKELEFGHVDKEKFEEIAKIYRLLRVIKKDYTLDNFIYCVHCKINNGLKLTKEEKNWLLNNKTIKIATHKNVAPVEYFDKNNQYSGLISSYLKLLEKKLDINFEIKQNKYWYNSIEMIKQHKVDMLPAAVKTSQREKYLNFSSVYLEFPTVILTKDTHNYVNNFSQLSNKIVAVEKEFYTAELLKQTNPNIKLLFVNTTEEAIKKVYTNEAFAYIGALPNIGYYVKKLNYTNLKINGDTPFSTKLSFAIRKDLYILNSILDKAINSITKEEHEKIYNDWVNVKYVYEAQIDYKKIIIYFLLIVIIFLFLLYRSEKLKKRLRQKEDFSNKLNHINQNLQSKNKNLKYISENDSLTNIANRRKLDEILEIEINRSKRKQTTLSIILIDIDLFKNVNDTFGHKVGDLVLKELSLLLNNNLRKYDFLGRWGGEEFLIICPQSDLKQTIKLANKLKNLIREHKFTNYNDLHLTISCGVAQFSENHDLDTLINDADKQLYLAKNNGRDSVYPKIE